MTVINEADPNGYIMHFEDGPLAVRANVSNLAGTPGNLVVKRDQFGWPLPNRLAFRIAGNLVDVVDADNAIINQAAVDGYYRKISESQLPDNRSSRVMRGAAYELEREGQ